MRLTVYIGLAKLGDEFVSVKKFYKMVFESVVLAPMLYDAENRSGF